MSGSSHSPSPCLSSSQGSPLLHLGWRNLCALSCWCLDTSRAGVQPSWSQPLLLPECPEATPCPSRPGPSRTPGPSLSCEEGLASLVPFPGPLLRRSPPPPASCQPKSSRTSHVLDRSPFRGSNSRKRRNLSRVTQQGHSRNLSEAPSEKEQEEPRMGFAQQAPTHARLP